VAEAETQHKIMRPKGKLLALVAMFAAVGLITATGAFTTVEAERTATVDVTGDSSALLGISEPSDIDEGSVSQPNGVAEIDLTSFSSAEGAAGLNPDANTTLTPLVNVTNQGSNTVYVDISINGVNTTINEFDSDDITVVDSEGNTFTETELSAGSGTQFGLIIDLTDVDQNDLDGFEIDIQISANEESTVA
jgi:hypothetical protein